jgi:hypothetical protein
MVQAAVSCGRWGVNPEISQDRLPPPHHPDPGRPAHHHRRRPPARRPAPSPRIDQQHQPTCALAWPKSGPALGRAASTPCRAASRTRTARRSGRPRRMRAGTSRTARRARLPGRAGRATTDGCLGHQAGVSLRPAPPRPQHRVRGQRGGISGRVPVGWPVRMGGGRGRAPRGPDIHSPCGRAGWLIGSVAQPGSMFATAPGCNRAPRCLALGCWS